MCAEVTTIASTNWFAAPYGYAGIFVPTALLKWAATWLMRNHDASNLNSYAAFSLPFFVTPLSGCTFYDFEYWSTRSANNTVLFNYYPMTQPAAAFGSTAVGGTAGQRGSRGQRGGSCRGPQDPYQKRTAGRHPAGRGPTFVKMRS